MPRRYLVLLSGGLDSTALLASLILQKHDVEALSVDYGQRHNKEVLAAARVTGWYGVRHTVLDLSGWGEQVASALTSGTRVHPNFKPVDVPEGHYAADNMSVTVVPNRNATFLMAAAGIAASRNLNVVATAVHSGDHPIYPDCRPEFITAASHASRLGCGVDIVAPFAYLTKTEVILRGVEADAPLWMTWSCYQGGEMHCGRCGTCVERAEAFDLAGVLDPTMYADAEYWRTVT